MTLVQNHLQQSNGNKIIKITAMLFAVLLLHSCTLFKPVNTATGQKPDDFPTDITGPVTVDPNTGEHDELLEYYELYEKIKVPFINVFMRSPIEPSVMT